MIISLTSPTQNKSTNTCRPIIRFTTPLRLQLLYVYTASTIFSHCSGFASFGYTEKSSAFPVQIITSWFLSRFRHRKSGSTSHCIELLMAKKPLEDNEVVSWNTRRRLNSGHRSNLSAVKSDENGEAREVINI